MPRNPEQIIASAIATGRIPKSRAKFYRDMASSGTDISFVDTYAAAPGVGQLAAEAAQDDEDEAYRRVFGDDGTRAQVAASAAHAAHATDEEVYRGMFDAGVPDEPPSAEYRALFPERDEAQAMADARETAHAAAVAALSEDELWREMGFDRKRGSK